MAIPKKIFTIWLQESGEMPEMIRRCIESQRSVEGYEHHLVTLDNLPKGHEYVQQCLDSKHPDGVKFCKLSDWMRMHYMIEGYGVYCDADVEILPGRNFDKFLSEKMFGCREKNGWVGSAVLGAVKDSPFVKEWKEIVERDFHGGDNKNFQSSMEILNTLNRERDAVSVLPQETFFPYCHQSGTINVTKDTVCLHHFMKSWTV